jgi:hypothetical protein
MLHLALSGPTPRATLIELNVGDPEDLEESFTHLAGIGLIASDAECDHLELPFKLLPILLPGLFPDD